MSQKHYSNKKILETGAQYLLQLGERSNGKSYSDKYYILYNAYHEKDLYTGEPIKQYRFAYLRRWNLELKSADVADYFADMIANDNDEHPIEEITGGEYKTIAVYQKRIYFANVNNDTGKTERGKLIGNCFALTQETHYKSLSFPLTGTIIFEEFITDTGYLENEPRILFSIVSTILRRRRGTVFLVGNTISRACPYFDTWGLAGVLTQRPGTIAIYNQLTDQVNDDGSPVVVKIAVEHCDNSGANSQMFFGESSRMITSGGWDVDAQPRLEYFFNEYKQRGSMLFDFDNLKFRALLLQDPEKQTLVYVYPYTKKIEDDDTSRILTDRYSLKKTRSAVWLTNIFKWDKVFIEHLLLNRVAFSDDLTGTEFRRMLKDHNLI